MEKVIKIIIVFGLLMLVILRSIRGREKRYREYYFSRRLQDLPQAGDAGLVSVMVDRDQPGNAKDMEHQLLFVPAEQAVHVVDDLSGKTAVMIRLEASPHGLLYDGRTGLLYCCSADGMVQVVRKGESGHYMTMQSILIPAGAVMMMLDPRAGELWIQTGEGIDIYTNV